MRELWICLLVCFVFLSGLILQPAGTAAAPSLDTADLEPFLDNLVEEQMEEWNIANLTLSVVADGEVVLAKGYGFADMEQETPVDPDTTLFRIGSTSKLFTWTAVMQLVEEGMLDLDTDINEYLDFEIPSHLEYGQNQTALEPITLRHLMSHTPGFEDYLSGIFALSEEDLLPLDRYVREERPARVFPPGEVPAYSNYGAALTGYIVEVVSGMPYAAYVEENIYSPLGMENSSFRQPLPSEIADNMAGAYRYVEGEFLEGEFEFMPEPAGSMSSSASDMARFMLAYLQEGELEGERILAAETVEEMFTEQFTVHPDLDNTAHGFIKTAINGRDVVHHPGGTMLFNTGMYLVPEEETGFFISHSGGSYLANIEIPQQFMDRYFPSEETAAEAEASEDIAESAEEYTGEYHQNRRSFTTMDKLLSILIGVVRVDTDEEGFLSVSHSGATNQFTEVEPGEYQMLREDSTQSYGEDFRTIIFSTDPLGKKMLLTHGPVSYSKAAWYETFAFTVAALATSVIFIIGSFFYWTIKAGVFKLRRKESSVKNPGAVWAKRTVVTLGVFTLVFLIQFLMESAPDPVYGLPGSAYSPQRALLLDTIVSYAIVLLALTSAVFTIFAWGKSYWRLPGRVHYTLFTGAGLILAWIFYFWQVI